MDRTKYLNLCKECAMICDEGLYGMKIDVLERLQVEYKGINYYLNENEFPKNVHPIMSAWKYVKMDNPHNLPCSHVLYQSGETTAPKYGAVYCGGNCSKCAFH